VSRQRFSCSLRCILPDSMAPAHLGFLPSYWHRCDDPPLINLLPRLCSSPCTRPHWHCDSDPTITMQATADTQCTPDIAPCSSGDPSESSQPSPPTPSPSPRASDNPPDHPSKIIANNCANGRQLRSKVWFHFIQAIDYETSKKSRCVHCGTVFTSRYGSTSSLAKHLEKKHPEQLNASDGAEALGR
jgi:BED zinc finger